MSYIENIVIGSARADKAQLKLDSCHDFFDMNPFRFTPKGEETLYKVPLIGFVSKKDLGTVRVASEDDVLMLIEKTKVFEDSYMLEYLSNIPQIELSRLTLSFIFLPYDPTVKVSSHLNNMLLYLKNMKEGSSSGKLDYIALEKEFSAIIKNDSLSDYIPQARKHSYLKVLGGRKNGNV